MRTQKLPGRGRIGIFNRSYYEEVLVVRVHPEILVGEGVADTPRATRRTSGSSGIARFWIWRSICIATARAS
jgi:polyphosphate kinase 2 (PPK2 family)